MESEDQITSLKLMLVLVTHILIDLLKIFVERKICKSTWLDVIQW